MNVIQLHVVGSLFNLGVSTSLSCAMYTYLVSRIYFNNESIDNI